MIQLDNKIATTLARGLHSEYAIKAIEYVCPYGVILSSCLWTDDKLYQEKLKMFFENFKRAQS